MCRMLAVVGSRAAAVDLAARFPIEASRGRVGATMTPGHKDGWGLVYAEHANDLRYAGRSIEDAARDPAYPVAVEALRVRAPASRTVLLAHVRKLTMGARTLDDTHPFIGGGFAFCHNGTVRGVAPKGQSDSRALFARLLAEMAKGATPEDAISTLAHDIDARGREHYTSVTFLLTDGARAWGLRRIGADPVVCAPEACPQDYYTLGHATLPDGSIVVSQEHELLGIPGWRPIGDGEMVRVAADGSVTTTRVL